MNDKLLGDALTEKTIVRSEIIRRIEYNEFLTIWSQY